MSSAHGLSPTDTLPWIKAAALPPYQDPPPDRPAPPIDAGWFERSLPGHIALLAAGLPEHPAISDGTRRMTFAALDLATRRLAHSIIAARLPDGPIGVLLADDAHYLIGILACLAAGRHCLLLNTENPPDYLARIVEAAGLAGILVATAGTSVPAGLATVPVAPALADTTPAPPLPETALRLGANAPAIILSTSGSTGAPKAVARSQSALLHSITPRMAKLRTSPDDRAMMIGPPDTSGAVSNRFAALLAGASLHIADLPRIGLGGVLRLLAQAEVTMLRATPSLLKSLARLDGATAGFVHLRTLLIGGDALLQADLRAIRARLPATCRVHYGLSQSEAANIAHWCVPPDDTHDPVRVAAGYLGEGVEALLVDEHGQPVPPGEPGELMVRTARAAVGDLAAGRLDDARFPADPSNPGRRVFLTGDIVRITADGVLVVLGRRDRMVKINGLRVEPTLIEAALRAVPGVADAAVAARKEPGTVRLCGFVVPATPADPRLLDTVRTALREALPPHMRPSALLVVDAVPVAPSGKPDHAALLRQLPGAA